jgi:hypothetical protein
MERSFGLGRLSAMAIFLNSFTFRYELYIKLTSQLCGLYLCREIMASDDYNSEQLRETIEEGYDNEYDALAQPPLLSSQDGVALNGGGGFETDFASFASSHKKYLWSQRMKNAMRWLACIFMALSTVRAVFIMWLMYAVTGRVVTWLPFSVETFLGFIFAGFSTPLITSIVPFYVSYLAY